MGFSANAFLDAYQGNVNTLNYIREERINKFHIMMADIYEKSS